ncbi:GNAT family N-acetyltransferase [Mumia sp. zg.B53]|nr:GNAT family N-acetyltransferase [Mumia sp. zg.B21]MBW9215331.1 GNAT family N-acetyltransferase [Mumia sp. zg.B53]
MSAGWPATLQHGDVGLRPIRRGDARVWARLRQESSDWLGRWEATLPRSAPSGTRSYGAAVRSLRQQASQGRALPFVTTYGGGDEMIGQVTVSGMTWGSARWAQIGYWIARPYAGRGITTTAVALATDHCFEALGLHRIEIAIRPENRSSLRIVDKLGFDRVGLAPRYLHIDGAWRDHLLFAITAEQVLPGGLIARADAAGVDR